MKKILILTREFRGVPMGYGEEFRNAGCTVMTITSPVDCNKWDFIFRVKKRFGLSNENYYKKKDEKFAKKVYSICNEFNPDIIYVCHGTQLRPDTIMDLKKKYYMVADLIDKIEFFPVLKDYVSYYDVVYTYNIEDCQYMISNGINCKHMPATGNSHIFKKMDCKKDIDIAFVGATYPESYYGNRLEIINRLIEDFPDKKIFIGGQCAPLRRPKKFIKWFFDSKKRSIFNNRDIDSYECNKIYNRSKICLNINRINTGEGWSERFGNIMFSGSFQIVNYNRFIAETFGDAVETFQSYDELREKIRYLLNNSDELGRRTEKGYLKYRNIIEKQWEKFNIVEDVIRECDRKQRNLNE